MKILKIIGVIVGLLLVLFFAAGLIVPQVTYQTSITVNKPLEETFALFNDIEQLNQWIPDVKSFEIIYESPDKIGTKYKMIVENEGTEMEMIETLKEYELNKKVTLDFDAGDMHKLDTYEFETSNNSTIIKADHICEGNSYLFKCIFAFFKGMFRGIDQEYMDNFKKFAESNI